MGQLISGGIPHDIDAHVIQIGSLGWYKKRGKNPIDTCIVHNTEGEPYEVVDSLPEGLRYFSAEGVAGMFIRDRRGTHVVIHDDLIVQIGDLEFDVGKHSHHNPTNWTSVSVEVLCVKLANGKRVVLRQSLVTLGKYLDLVSRLFGIPKLFAVDPNKGRARARARVNKRYPKLRVFAPHCVITNQTSGWCCGDPITDYLVAEAGFVGVDVGSLGDIRYIKGIQREVRTTVDGVFGPATRAACRDFGYVDGMPTRGLVRPEPEPDHEDLLGESEQKSEGTDAPDMTKAERRADEALRQIRDILDDHGY